MGMVLTTIKRKLCILSTIFSIILPISEKVLADPSPFTYDHLLEQANAKIKSFDYGRALDRLEIARNKNPSLDYRYYYLLGDAYFGMGRAMEGLSAYHKSLDLEPGQPDLLLKLTEFQANDRRPAEALAYLKRYLRFLPQDKQWTYRAGILAKQSGDNAYANQAFASLESDKNYEIERDAILSELKTKTQAGDWQSVIEMSRKYLLYFPREEVVYEYLILALRGIDHPEVEKAMVDASLVFSQNANFTVRYGIYLQEKERMLEALASFRRALTISFLTRRAKGNRPDPGNDQANSENEQVAANNDRLRAESQDEILFLIRQTYSFLNRQHDVKAISNLQKVHRLIREGNPRGVADLEQAVRTYPKNRETLVYAVQELEKKELYNAMLSQRDRENEEKELIYVIGPFSREVLD